MIPPDNDCFIIGTNGTVMSLMHCDKILTVEELVWNICGINRYTGGTNFSVGQHTLLVDALCKSHLKPHALVHDLHEGITGDVSTPVKQAVDYIGNGGWTKFETAVASRVRRWFKLACETPEEVKEIDRLSRGIEVAYLFNTTTQRAYADAGVPVYYDKKCKPYFVHRTREQVARELMVRLKMEGLA